jgi:hypothetical protein
MATTGRAGVCDYRPSELLRGEVAASVMSGARDAAGLLLERSGGIFVLNGAIAGVSLFGAGGGTGGAGALGQIGSAAGNVAAGATASPGAALAGTAAILGAGVYEGLCFFRDTRITDYNEVLDILRAVAAFTDPAFFHVVESGTDRDDAVIVLGNGAGATVPFRVDRLRIVNGVLLHREFGLDTELGDLGYLTATLPDD